MPTNYYTKEIPEMAVYVHGTPLKFELLETSDAALIVELDRCIQFGRGGIKAITKEQFDEEAKKKPPVTVSESGYKQKQQRLELSSPHLSHDPAAGGADIRIGNVFARPQEREHAPHNRHGLPAGAPGPAPIKRMPDPIELPSTDDFRPPTAKMSQVNGA